MTIEASKPSHVARRMVADKAALRRILEEQDKQTGFVLDPSATPQ